MATTPYLRALTAHPTPILGGNPVFVFFFHQNDHKGWKRDVLDAWGHFLLRFCVAGHKPSGGGRTRVKVFYLQAYMFRELGDNCRKICTVYWISVCQLAILFCLVGPKAPICKLWTALNLHSFKLLLLYNSWTVLI